MIKLFRKIRQNLLIENQPGRQPNKTRKYLKYAVGEVILVVIGILIALWINNTYQDYKNSQLTNSFLLDFKRDLLADTRVLDKRIKTNETMVKNIDSIIIFFQTKKELTSKELHTFATYNLSIMYESYFIPEKSTLRQFESSNNNNLISSKLLKDKLFEYHTINDRNEKNMETSVQLYQHNFFTRDFMKLLAIKEFKMLMSGLTPALSQESLKKITLIEDYWVSLFQKKGLTENQNKNYSEVSLKAKEILKLIEAKLKK
ncbi:DUF6090 family protein [Polaribacter glomeratus]|uniref:Uncharacterized protein n=1 Tax=Polaribacter glomeratus TaxID=102 RepID=A0A2S7WWR9_9FLAO|nr:DUF6090 family protein [Polaribacter glomeratus]PQJ81722.1 hypothetical protein BTO16_03680 [Polaribacter glomeratus]TXD66353.1 hypothetical protein ESX12_06095 [Polaribacter glomeratus]